MGAGGFLGGLVGGYATQMLKKVDMEHQQEQEDKRNRIQYLQAAIGSGKLTPDAMNAAIDELGEITGSGGGTKKGKGGGPLDILKKLAGHVQPQQMPEQFEKRVQGAAPPTLGTPPQPAAKANGNGATATLGAPPAAPQRKIYKTAQDEEDEKISAEKREDTEINIPREQREATQRAAELKEQREFELQKEQFTIQRDEINKAAANARQILIDQQNNAQKQAHDAVEISLQKMKDITEIAKEGSVEDRAAKRAGQAELKAQMTGMIRTLSTSLASARGEMKSITTRNETLKKAQEKWAADNGIKSAFGASMAGEPEDVTETNEKIENTDRAIKYLNYNNNPDVLGDEDKVRSVFATAESILAGEGPEMKRSTIKAQYPNFTTEQVDQLLNKFKASGYKTTND